MDRDKVGQSCFLEILFGQTLSWTESVMGKVGLDRALGGQGNSWTEFYLEITYGQSLNGQRLYWDRV